jgi:hypothetical protein
MDRFTKALMKSIRVIVSLLMACLWSALAHADYSFVTIVAPNTTNDSIFTINNEGYVGVNTDQGVYIYHAGIYTLLSPQLPATAAYGWGLFGVAGDGTKVGSYFDANGVEHGLIISSDSSTWTSFDAIALSLNSSSVTVISTEIRAISEDGGTIAGIYDVSVNGIPDAGPNGFTCQLNSAKTACANLTTDFPKVPNKQFVIAQAINANGDVVGSVVTGESLDTGTKYAFLYHALNQSVDMFEVNTSLTTGFLSNARGINDAGTIAGFTRNQWNADATDNTVTLTAFVGDLTNGFTLVASPSDLNYGYTCSAAAPCPTPADSYTLAEGINNSGQISGGWQIGCCNPGDPGYSHGAYIASPAQIISAGIPSTLSGAAVLSVGVANTSIANTKTAPLPAAPVFVDPQAAMNYAVSVARGDPLIATARMPIGYGNNQYTLVVEGRGFAVTGGQLFDFRAHGHPNGVGAFRITGINSATILPQNLSVFPVQLAFQKAGPVTLTMTPLCPAHPWPAKATPAMVRALKQCSKA